MNISTSNYDIASLLSTYASQRKTSYSSDTSTTETSKTSSAVDSLMKRLAPPDMGDSIMSLSASGQKVKDSIKPPEPPTEEMKAAMDQVRSDFETLESSDVESLSEEDAKAMLEQLVADMGQLPANSSTASSSTTSSSVDVSTMTDDEIKEILQGLKEKLAEGPKMQGPPPQGAMGFDIASILGTDSEDSESSATDIATATSEMAQNLVDILAESFDSSSESSNDYATRLKESIAELLEKRKTEMDDFASALNTQLDAWSSSVQ